MVIQAASALDLPEVRRLLERHHLPLEGVDDHVHTMVVAKEGPRIIGTAAVELYGDGALLRSVAVDPARQDQRLGHQLVSAALTIAQTHGAGTVFLLTTTAAGFFSRLGFEPVERDAVPAAVQASVEFQSACPASAVVTRRLLADGR